MARCSKDHITDKKYRRVAAVIPATLCVFCLFLLCPEALYAEVNVEGLNDWLTSAAERSLSAVYNHIPENESKEVKEELVTLVANRLLVGYVVERAAFRHDGGIDLLMKPTILAPDWEVALVMPNLSAPVDGWFARDLQGLDEDIRPLLQGVPIEAIAWGDVDLKAVIDELVDVKVPGWRAALMVRNVQERAIIELSFTPENPLALAVSSRISSTSIPVMLHSSLKEDLLKGYAPVIGVPVRWLDTHKDDLVVMSKEILAEDYVVDRGKAEALIAVKTGTLSEVDIELESRRYSAWVWVAVYAGAEDKYPEAGLHFGRRAQLLPRWDSELYTELILALDDWNLETRFGLRWEVWRNFWVGGEWSHPDSDWWLRATYSSRPGRPYAWLRYNPQGETNGAVGYRLNEYISLEVHYDSRDEEPWNVRALVNL